MSIAALGSILSAALTTAGNIALSERQRKQNEALQDKMNQYNLPVNQVQRLKDAGINPNSLSMGQGSDIPGNTSAPVNPYATPSLADPMSLISNSFLTMQQGTTEEQMRELRKQEAVANIDLLNQNASKIGVDTQYQSILNTFAAAREHSALVGQFRQNDLALWQTAKVKQEARQLAKYIDEVMPEEIKQLVLNQQLTVGQMDQLIATIANIEQDTSLKGAQEGLATEQAEGQQLENARYNEVTDKILAQYQATINKLAAECDLTQQEAFYYLYELCRKYGIKIMGVPVPGQGGFREIGLNEGLQKQAAQKYGFPQPISDRLQ